MYVAAALSVLSLKLVDNSQGATCYHNALAVGEDTPKCVKH